MLQVFCLLRMMQSCHACLCHDSWVTCVL
jgi:hypothetical protein